jgi:CelD/BcsL family acetyltransferase involved in cellulose biosynthesis
LRMILSDVDALSPAQIGLWDGLLAELPARSPFLSYAFCHAVHQARGGGRVLSIAMDGGDTGFLPFQIKAGRELLKHAEKPGGGLSDMFGIVGTIRSALEPEALLRSADLSSLRFDHAVEDLCPFRFGDREETTGVRVLVENFPTFLSSLAQADPEFVGMVAAGTRRIAKKVGPIRFEWHTADPHGELDRLIEVKREQYIRTGMRDGLAESWKRSLLHNLLDQQAPLCKGVLATLHAGKDWVASLLALTCADTFHVWFPAYNPQFGRFGPGHMLLFKIFEHGADQGLRWFDFGQGDATYKARYRGDVYKLWKGAIRRCSIFGYSERVLQSLEWRMRKRGDSQPEAISPRVDPLLGVSAAHGV